MRTRWTMAFLLSICLLLPEAFSCGPDFPVAIFVRKTMPDTPLTRFAGGELGLVQPSWFPSYLVVAYRYLSGAPLSPAEQNDAVEYWKKQNSDMGSAIAEQNSAVQKWEKARQLVPNVSASTIANQEAAFGWATFTNCTDGAFINAAETLHDRIRTLGAASPWIRNWVEAQDAVFSNCGEKAPLVLPQPASNAAPAIIAADRQYQTAAAYFYGGKFDDAANGFRRIAANAGSPWHQLAPYLVARTLIRESTMSAGSEQDCASKGYCGFDATPMFQAEQQLRAILADPSLASEHRSARLLLDLVRARLQPMEYAEELSRRVSHTDQDFGHDASDLVWMIHKLASQQGYGVLVFPVSGKQGDPAVAAGQKTAQLMQASDLGDWLVTFPPTGGPATAAADVRAHALEKWHATHSAAWLICAMSQPGLSEDEQKELLAAARSIPTESPAFATVSYLRTALLKANHDPEDARKVVSAALSAKNSLPISAVNALKSEQIGLARSLEEFLHFAQQDPAVIGDDMSGNVELPFNFGPGKSRHSQVAFSEQAAVTLNRMMPIADLLQAVESNELAPNLRRDLALSAWVRAALLPEAKEISVQLARIIPDMEPTLKAPMEAYLHSASEAADERSFAAVYTILQFPGLRPWVQAGIGRMACCNLRMEPLKEIDEYRDNWWCSLADASGHPSYAWLYPGRKSAVAANIWANPAPAAPFLSEEQSELGRQQWQQLAAMGSAPDYLSSQVIAFAKGHPADPRVPEALYLAVRATRYGCTDKNTGELSHTAFDLLHQRYANSEWARKTPYWFQQ